MLWPQKSKSSSARDMPHCTAATGTGWPESQEEDSSLMTHSAAASTTCSCASNCQVTGGAGRQDQGQDAQVVLARQTPTLVEGVMIIGAGTESTRA